MEAQKAAWLAWELAALAVVGSVGAIAWTLAGEGGMPFNDPSRSAWIDYMQSLLFPIVGALIAWKRPDNSVGWLLLGYSVTAALGGVLAEYAQNGVILDPGSLPGAGGVAWVATWFWIGVLPLIPLTLLHFPTGQLPSPGWRWARWFCGVPILLITVPATAWLGEPAREFWRMGDGVPPGTEWTRPWMTAVFATLILSVLASLVSLVMRYRRAGYQERQQLKWIMLAAGVLIVHGIWETFLPISSHLAAAAGAFAFAAIPASMGVAILRYRLYDIDRIINRALVYGAVTAVLALVYVTIVVGAGDILRGATGERNNSLVVAASTLVVAALFRPARARIQRFIDRRFYRSRYDAARTVEAFSARLRNEVDLKAMTHELVSVVTTTMQPRHASIWLRS